jgi:dienelactone hydrolase
MRRWHVIMIMGILLIAPAASFGWPGHEWARWKEVTTWKRIDLPTGQEGRKDLMPLLGGQTEAAKPINSIAGWESRRAELAEAITAILGASETMQIPDVEVKVLGEEQLADHTRRHLRIRSETEDWIPAYLLLPRPMPEGKLPAMLCLHQTVAWGKREPCGVEGDRELAFALELVRRGYVCLAPDAIGFGERIPAGTQPYHDSIEFYRRHPQWSFMGKMNWDVARAIDYLETLPFVDPQRMGCIGHSHGAYGSLFAAAFEPRLSAVIASCGFTTFRSDPSPHRWSHATALIPQLGTYLPVVADIPFDWHHVCALTAPRPMFIWYATQDTIFPKTDNLELVFQDVRSLYELYGARDSLTWTAFDGPHKIPADGRHAAYDWLKRQWEPSLGR